MNKNMNIDKITSAALQLNSQDRALLAETLWESIEDPYMDNGSDKTSIHLAMQRNDELDSGVVTALSHQDLMNKLRNNED